MLSENLDARVLCALARQWGGRLKRPTFLGVVIVAAQLSELVLAGALDDYADGPIPGRVAHLNPRLTPVFERVREMQGWRWDQLFWRGGIDTATAFADTVAWLTDNQVWEVKRAGWRGRSLQYVEPTPGNTNWFSLDGTVLARDVSRSNATLAVFTSLYQLGLGPQGVRYAKWRPASPIVDEPLLTEPKKTTLIKIVVAAEQPFNLEATRGDRIVGGN